MRGTTAFVVSSNAVEGRADELRTWYHDVHLADARLIPGVASATLYEWRRSRADRRPATRSWPSTKSTGTRARCGRSSIGASPTASWPCPPHSIWRPCRSRCGRQVQRAWLRPAGERTDHATAAALRAGQDRAGDHAQPDDQDRQRDVLHGGRPDGRRAHGRLLRAPRPWGRGVPRGRVLRRRVPARHPARALSPGRLIPGRAVALRRRPLHRGVLPPHGGRPPARLPGVDPAAAFRPVEPDRVAAA